MLFRSSLQNRLSQATRPDDALALQSSLDDAVRKIDTLQLEEKKLREGIQILMNENFQLSTHLHAIQQVQRPINPAPESQATSSQDPKYADPSDTASDPDWIKEWRSGRTFSKESAALILMGETGKCLRPSLIELLAKSLAWRPPQAACRKPSTG